MYEKVLLWFVLSYFVYNVMSPAADQRKIMINKVTALMSPIFPTNFPLLPLSINPNIYEEHHLIFSTLFWVKLIVR